jgi:hypothetical protein
MSEKRIAANRRNSKVSTGPISRTGKQRSARNALKHGLSVPTDPAGEDVRALAALLSPAPAEGHITALAVEAARRIIDFDRVKEVHKHLYSCLGTSPVLMRPPIKPQVDLGGLAQIAARFVKELQPPTAAPLTILDLAKQLDKLARYERRSLSLRERALRELADGITKNKGSH